jgi:hypothetical protein
VLACRERRRSLLSPVGEPLDTGPVATKVHASHAGLSVCRSGSCSPGPILHVLSLQPRLGGVASTLTRVSHDQVPPLRVLWLIGRGRGGLGLVDGLGD